MSKLKTKIQLDVFLQIPQPHQFDFHGSLGKIQNQHSYFKKNDFKSTHIQPAKINCKMPKSQFTIVSRVTNFFFPIAEEA
jgi:hypothetical protein